MILLCLVSLWVIGTFILMDIDYIKPKAEKLESFYQIPTESSYINNYLKGKLFYLTFSKTYI